MSNATNAVKVNGKVVYFGSDEELAQAEYAKATKAMTWGDEVTWSYGGKIHLAAMKQKAG